MCGYYFCMLSDCPWVPGSSYKYRSSFMKPKSEAVVACSWFLSSRCAFWSSQFVALRNFWFSYYWIPIWNEVWYLSAAVLTIFLHYLSWQILDTNPQLFFHLQQQRLIELIRAGKIEEALEFAQEELAPRGEENVRNLLQRAILIQFTINVHVFDFFCQHIIAKLETV